MKIDRSTPIIVIYFALAIVYFYFMGDKMLNEETFFRFFADSSTYEEASVELKNLSLLQLFAINPNYFGPLTILRIVDGSRWGVLTLNILVFILCLKLFYMAFPLRKYLFVSILLLNPITFSSLLSINKEIFSILTVALLVYGRKNRKILPIFACLLLSFFVRWQFTLVIITFLLMVSPLNVFRNRRFLSLSFLLIAVSILFDQFSSTIFSNATEVGISGGEQWDGSGLWGRLLDVQTSGGYFLVFFVKILHSMFGLLSYFYKIFDPPEFYNYVVVMLHSFFMLIIFIYAFIRRKLDIGNELLYIGLIYLIIFGLTPIYAPRYFYPVYVLLCILVAEKAAIIYRNSLI